MTLTLATGVVLIFASVCIGVICGVGAVVLFIQHAATEADRRLEQRRRRAECHDSDEYVSR